jgi:hypothetical protein
MDAKIWKVIWSKSHCYILSKIKAVKNKDKNGEDVDEDEIDFNKP